MRKKIFFGLVLVLIGFASIRFAEAVKAPPYLGMWGKNGKFQEIKKNLHYEYIPGGNTIIIEKEKELLIPTFSKNEVELYYYFYDIPKVGSILLYGLRPVIFKSGGEEYKEMNVYRTYGGVPFLIKSEGNMLFGLDTNPKLSEAAEAGLYMILCEKGCFLFYLN